jgi:hypothetical protein
MTTVPTEHKVEVMPMNVGMTAVDRCDRCGAQAFYEVEVGYTKEVEPGRLQHIKGALKFCAHHARKHHDAIMKDENVVRVFDHRPVLHAEEQGKPAEQPT